MADTTSLSTLPGASAANQPAPQTAQEDVQRLAPLADTLTADDEPIEADNDSAFGDGSISDGTSIRSSILKGYVENGRRYSNLRGENEVYAPSDAKQFEVYETIHLVLLILDSQRRNPLFQSPISKKAQNVLDIGTGDGSWPLDVADKFPNLTVHGVDLYPPPHDWVAPNCILEVDDITKQWSWSKKFSLIHMRQLMGFFTLQEWKTVYKQAYDNLEPGGWFEQVESDVQIKCDDGTMPADSHLAKFHEVANACALKAGRPLDTYHHFEQRIRDAGFINVHKTDYKAPYGEWPKLPVYKDAGRIGLKLMKAGLEGWMMRFLTQHGDPTPWSPEEVHVYLAKLRNNFDSGWHIYQRVRRVWAQKPYDDTVEKHDEPIVENVASPSG